MLEIGPNLAEVLKLILIVGLLSFLAYVFLRLMEDC